MLSRKPLVVASTIAVAALALMMALPSGVSFARRAVRPSAPPPTVDGAPASAPRAPAPTRPLRALRPSSTPAPRPFGRVPGTHTPEPKRTEAAVEGALLDGNGEPFVGSIAAVPVGGGDAHYVDTDPAGRFALRLPPGTYTFSVYANGDVAPEVIESLPVEAGEELHGVVVRLPPDAFERDCDDDDLREFDPDRHFDDNPDLDLALD